MRKIRGGSVSSDYVNQLCQLNDDNLIANRIIKGGSRQVNSKSKSVKLFDNYVYSLIKGGASAQHVVKSVQNVLQEKKNHQMFNYLLNDFVQRHSHKPQKGGKKQKHTQRKKKQAQKQTKQRRQRLAQRGGATATITNADGSVQNDVNYLYTDTSEYRGTTGDSNILTGSSNPPSMYQKFMDWFNGKTTIFTPSYSDVTNPSGAQLQCAGNSCAVTQTASNIVPKLDNKITVGTIVDPVIDGGDFQTVAFPSIASITPLQDTVLPALNRA